MEYKEIKKLIDDMGNSKLQSLDIEFPEGIKISMTKARDEKTVLKDNSTVQIVENKEDVIIQKEEIPNKEIEEGKYIKSPMVGTFYSKSSPDARPFVEIGQTVKKGDTLCIIEAMKLMNQIESEYDGKVTEILVKDEEMVDYGKPLFKIV